MFLSRTCFRAWTEQKQQNLCLMLGDASAFLTSKQYKGQTPTTWILPDSDNSWLRILDVLTNSHTLLCPVCCYDVQLPALFLLRRYPTFLPSDLHKDTYLLQRINADPSKGWRCFEKKTKLASFASTAKKCLAHISILLISMSPQRLLLLQA